jgi:hypothetical protein
MTVYIDHDHLDDKPTVGRVLRQMPLYGIERAAGLDDSLPEAPELVPFRLYDDDGELCYSGRLHDDDDCENQSAALRYGESDVGATTIKVKRGNEWKQEIG